MELPIAELEDTKQVWQVVAEEAPDIVEYLPARHGTQSLSDIAAVNARYLPAPQFTQELANRYFPTPQTIISQLLAKEAPYKKLCLPTGQLRQVEALDAPTVSE
jgi:hypothetical protein